MSSYQRVALFIFFDAIEKDLVDRIRSISNKIEDNFLSEQERTKGKSRFEKNYGDLDQNIDDFTLLNYIDLGDKISAIQRFKSHFEDGFRKHFSSKISLLQDAVSIRNSVMHGRPLTITEHASAFALANDLVKSKGYWPNLYSEISEYNNDPESVTRKAISFLEEPSDSSVYHNLPLPDYDDTGFVPRPQLEQELKKKILSRHPVVTVLGDGGNGKTALTLQTLYSLINSGDHSFEAVVWVTAKSSKLTIGEIQRIENSITTSMGIFEEVADLFKDKGESPLSRVRQLLENNKILLVIDNLETVLDDTIRDFCSDVPGESKLVLTSRIPVGSDLTVNVAPLSDNEGQMYLRALIKSYGIRQLATSKPEELSHYVGRLHRRPLLLKWFCMGVISGLQPAKIVSNPIIALKYCLENVFDALSENASQTLSLMSILPRAASLGVLAYISGWDIRKLESGIAELMKFSIIESENQSGFELNYKIKPFARAYISRILQLETPLKDKAISKFRTLTTTYQNERGAEGLERYNQRNFTVRSVSEALAVQKLREACKIAAKNEDFIKANDILFSVKISNPDYFEVYRAEAFIKFKQQDFPGATQSYENSIELSPNTPQIYYFFGGFLLRAYDDCKGAVTQLEKALEFDKESPEVLRELARAKMFDFDFRGAEEILSAELRKPINTKRHSLIFSDLRVQNFARMISHAGNFGIDSDLEKPCLDFSNFLSELDPAIVDDTMLEHLHRARSSILQILLARNVSNGRKLIDILEKFIHLSTPAFRTPVPLSQGFQSDPSVLQGYMKGKGRKPTFGFLVDSQGKEYFIAKDGIGEVTWRALEGGAYAVFDIETDDLGRFRAINVKIVS